MLFGLGHCERYLNGRPVPLSVGGTVASI